eukprot:1154939-Pelagomonas_calceolata.AAC.13
MGFLNTDRGLRPGRGTARIAAVYLIEIKRWHNGMTLGVPFIIVARESKKSGAQTLEGRIAGFHAPLSPLAP